MREIEIYEGEIPALDELQHKRVRQHFETTRDYWACRCKLLELAVMSTDAEAKKDYLDRYNSLKQIITI